MLPPPTQLCLDLVSYFENEVLHAYRDVRGLWTIGRGHLLDQSTATGHETITAAQSLGLLKADVHQKWKWMTENITTYLTAHQVDAVTSMIYNVGEEGWSGSTMNRLIEAGKWAEAADEFHKWDHAGAHEIKGLLRRRLAEKALYLWTPDETPTLKQLLDQADAEILTYPYPSRSS